MSMFKVTKGISCHAWSPDRKRIAVCQNDEKVIIYMNADAGSVSQWKVEHVLEGHEMIVSAIDWSPVHNKIVTCSHDRNAFVWTLTGSEWKPSLSILRINRAALDVKWSPDGKKFAVASGSKIVPVCHYEDNNDWWISKMIKKHKSTVTCVAWHPNSQLLATGSTDFRCRVFSTYIENLDSPIQSPLGDTSQTPFGEMYLEFESSQGWVEGVAFSPSGNRLCFVGHDSSISFVTLGNGQPVCQTIKSKELPSEVCMFLTEDVVVAAGHNFNPEIYQCANGSWSSLGYVDKQGSGNAGEKKEVSNFSAARSLWDSKTTRGTDSNSGGNDLWTLHHNSVTDIKQYSRDTSKIDSFSTSGLDGRVVIWKPSDIRGVAGVAI